MLRELSYCEIGTNMQLAHGKVRAVEDYLDYQYGKLARVYGIEDDKDATARELAFANFRGVARTATCTNLSILMTMRVRNGAYVRAAMSILEDGLDIGVTYIGGTQLLDTKDIRCPISLTLLAMEDADIELRTIPIVGSEYGIEAGATPFFVCYLLYYHLGEIRGILRDYDINLESGSLCKVLEHVAKVLDLENDRICVKRTCFTNRGFDESVLVRGDSPFGHWLFFFFSFFAAI